MKACIAKMMKAEEFPDKRFVDSCWTHKLGNLFRPADLEADFDAALRADPDLRSNWIIVEDWTAESRYVRTMKADAVKLYVAITDKKHGVLSWLKARW